jgi:hypothetical protein
VGPTVGLTYSKRTKKEDPVWAGRLAPTKKTQKRKSSSSGSWQKDQRQVKQKAESKHASHQYSSVFVNTMIAVIGSVLALSALSYTDASGTTSRLQVQVSETMLVFGSWEPMVGSPF